MIVVEGFDTSGKSTLARTIGERANVPVLHTGGPTRSTSDVIACMARSENRLHERCVQDRVTHISESCYSMLTAPSKAAIALARLGNLRAARLVIYCRPPKNVMLEALQAHVAQAYDTPDHMRFVVGNAANLIAIYDTVMDVVSNIPGIRFIMYDRTLGPRNTDYVIEQAIGVLENARKR